MGFVSEPSPPARISKERKAEALAAIRAEIEAGGSLDRLRDDWMDVAHATWYRLIKSAKVEAECVPGGKPFVEPKVSEKSVEPLPQSSLRMARRKITRLRKSKVAKRGAALLPVPPPSYLVNGGAQASADFNFLSEAQKIYADAELLREHASKLEADENGVMRRKITLPKSFAASISQRMGLIDTLLKIMARAYEFERIRELYSVILHHLAEVDPGVAVEVVTRLEALNHTRGYTYAAPPSVLAGGGEEADEEADG